jgi:hypothetical protein
VVMENDHYQEELNSSQMLLDPNESLVSEQSMTAAYATNPRPCHVATQVDDQMLTEGADLYRSMSSLAFDDDLRNSEIPRPNQSLDISIDDTRSEQQEG